MTPRDEEEAEYGRERSAEERLAALPSYLRFTPEQIEAHRADNARALAESNSPFLKISSLEAQRVRAVREESDWRRSLASLDFAILTGDDSEETAARRHTAAQTLAENLAAQGRFDEAAKVTPSEAQAHEYLDLHEAVMRPDEDWCGAECDARFENDTTRLTREDITAEVYSIPHGKHMPVNKCSYCGGVNVRAAARENLERRGARARARALTEGMSPVRAAETLKNAKLTSGEVFK